jgi:hypothetical protein
MPTEIQKVVEFEEDGVNGTCLMEEKQVDAGI